MDTMMPVILAMAGRCVTCGRARCARPLCFTAALGRYAAAPVLSSRAAEGLIRRLVRSGMPRSRALAHVHQFFTVNAV